MVWCNIHGKHMVDVTNCYVSNNICGLLGTLCIISFNPPCSPKRGYYSHSKGKNTGIQRGSVTGEQNYSSAKSSSLHEESRLHKGDGVTHWGGHESPRTALHNLSKFLSFLLSTTRLSSSKVLAQKLEVRFFFPEAPGPSQHSSVLLPPLRIMGLPQHSLCGPHEQGPGWEGTLFLRIH